MPEHEKIMVAFDREIPVWVAWSNTDLTEGRGQSIPLCAAVSPEVADRIAEKRGVMGSNAHVTKERAYRDSSGMWFIPGRLELESEQDKAKRGIRERLEAAVKRAQGAGLSAEDINTLMGVRH